MSAPLIRLGEEKAVSVLMVTIQVEDSAYHVDQTLSGMVFLVRASLVF